MPFIKSSLPNAKIIGFDAAKIVSWEYYVESKNLTLMLEGGVEVKLYGNDAATFGDKLVEKSKSVQESKV